jgi:hypothetical protein
MNATAGRREKLPLPTQASRPGGWGHCARRPSFPRDEPTQSSARRPRLRPAQVSAVASSPGVSGTPRTVERAISGGSSPIRVNLIAAGFVDTPRSASLLGDELEKRRDHLRATLPIRRVVGPADVAALAVHIMTNTALTGATYDVDGGQQLVAG